MALVVIVIAAVLLVQTSYVQTKLATYAEEEFLSKIDADISFSKLHFRPFNTVVIRDLAIVDRNPVYPSEAAMEKFRKERGQDYEYVPYDTLVRAGYVVATFSLKGLSNHEGLHLTRVLVRDGRFNLVVEEDHITNLQRMFGLGPSTGERKEKTDKNVFDIKQAQLKNMIYSMQIIRARHPALRDDSISWSDLYIEDVNAEASNIRMSKGIMVATLDKASFKERTGFAPTLVTANCAVGQGQALIENIHIVEGKSDLNAQYFSMSFNKPRDFRTFTKSIRLDGKLLPSRVTSETLWHFASALKKVNLDLDVNGGEVHGLVNDLSLKNVRIKSHDDDFATTLSGNVKGLTTDNGMDVDVRITNCKTSTRGIECLISDATGKKVSFGEKVPDVSGLLNAHIFGPLDDLNLDASLNSSAGYIDTDLEILNLTAKNELMDVFGVINTDNLDIGKLLGNNLVHECSLHSALSATLRGEEGPQLHIDTLSISRLNVNKYDYSRILATGDLSKQKFNGRIISQDPNFNFLFQGIFTFSPKTQNAVYQFYANVGHADLHEMHIDSRENSTMSMRTNANFYKTASGVILGNIDVRDLKLSNDDERHNIGDISISSRSSDDSYRINLTSSFAEGSYSGTGPINKFATDIIGLTAKREMSALFEDSSFTWNHEKYDLSFKFIETKDITAFFKPGLYIDNNTTMNVNVSRDGIVDAVIKSHRVALKEKYFKDLDIRLDNKEGMLSGDLYCDDINLSALQLIDNTVTLYANNNQIGIGYNCYGDASSKTRGEFYARGDIERTRRNRPAFRLGILPSGFTFDDNDWSIMPANVDIEGSDIDVDNIQFICDDQEITVDGGISKEHADTMAVRLERFNLGIANAFMKNEQYNVSGALTGEAQVISYPNHKSKGFLVDFVSDSTSFAGTSLGIIKAHSDWDEDFERFNIKAGNNSTFDIQGNYTPSIRDVNLKASLKNFEVAVLKPLLKSVFSDMSGKMSVDANVSGTLDNLAIETTGGQFEETRLQVDYTKVFYTANGPFRITEYGMFFDNVDLKDDYHGKGVLSGSVDYDHFKDINLGIKIDVDDAKVIQLSEKESHGFYGDLTGTGTVGITGPLKAVRIDIDAATTSPGEFHIPTSSKGKGTTDLLTFKEEDKHDAIDPYEEMMKSLNEKTKSKNDLSVNVKARATQDVEAFLEIDKSTGNGLTGRGTGSFDIDIRASRGIFNLKGDYTLATGTYMFNALGLAKRQFDITEGSNVRFNGALKDTDLDIEALYKTKASIARLISDTTSVNTRRPVECGLTIGGKFSSPTLAFSINIPDLEPTIKSKVENALCTEDKVQKQFIALIVTNNFLPDEQSGVNDNASTSIIYSGVTGLISNQFNNIMEKLNIPLDFDMNYQQTIRGNDIFDVAVSTQLFNNRVVVNGNIGNRQFNTGNSNSDVVGDLDIEVKLDKQGSIRLNLFSHSADQYTNYLDNSQRNGIGVTFQQEFNRFGEMIRYMFASKKKKAQMDAEADERLKNTPKKKVSINEEGGFKVTLEE